MCSCCCGGDDVSQYTFERAPEPTDVYWENLKITTGQRILYVCKTYFYTFVVIGVCFGVTYGLNEVKESMQ